MSEKLTVYNPNVAPNPRDLAAARVPEFTAEEEATELALRMACEDPTEREHLSGGVGRARTRLKAAAVELARALAALIFAWLAQLLLNRSYRKVTENRGEVGRAERSALALQKLLSSFFIRRIVGGSGLLKALGASSRTDEADNTIHSLKVAERSYRVSYRAGDGFAGGLAEASDLPLIRVFLGVRITSGGVPVWCIKRFVRDEAGAWKELHSGTAEDAESGLIYFYMEPSHDHTGGPAGSTAQGLQPARQIRQAA